LVRWTPVNAAALQRRLATRLCELGGYAALVGAASKG
jgi:hypothetical protein